MAELCPRKQKYLSSRFPHAHLFCDVSDMGKKFARTANGCSEAVPKVWIGSRRFKKVDGN